MIKQKQYFLKGLLLVQSIGLLIYTFLAMQKDGLNFLEKALEFASSLTWIGQFTLDFACYLILSVLWIIWRNYASGLSILIAIAAGTLGIIFLAPYLLYLLYKEQGDLKRVLIGKRN